MVNPAGKFRALEDGRKRHRRFSGDGTWDKILSELLSHADEVGLIEWEVSVDSTVNRAHQHGTNLGRATGGSVEFTNLLVEPPDHAVGRPRGALTTKVHALCDARMRTLVVLLGTGQGGDSPMYPEVMASLRVLRRRKGRPRTKPDRTMADKAYASRANRKLLRDRGIEAVIPEKSDHIANRKRLGAKGRRPPWFKADAYKRRNVIERCFELFKQWRGIATRHDKLALTYRGGVVLRAITIWL